MTDPDFPSVSKILDWAWAGVLALIGLIYKKNEAELMRQRDTIEKISDKIDEKFDVMQTTIHGMHVEILKELGTKADK